MEKQLQTADTTIALSDLPADTCGMVTGIRQDQWTDNADVDRLIALGICPGRQVEMVKHGDPQIVRACGARVGVSKRLAASIMVQPCEKKCLFKCEAD